MSQYPQLSTTTRDDNILKSGENDSFKFLSKILMKKWGKGHFWPQNEHLQTSQKIFSLDFPKIVPIDNHKEVV